jgi:hypothetical protein
MGREKQKSEVKAPAYLDKAAQQLIQRAMQTSRIGYVPYYGPDVAAMTPMQMASMRGTNQMAGAFGMPTANLSQGMPRAQNYGGLMGYSSGGMSRPCRNGSAAIRANIRKCNSCLPILARGKQNEPTSGRRASGRDGAGYAAPV